jgi:hypothetical protein
MSVTANHLSIKSARLLVDELRTFINSADHTNSPRFADLAWQYAEAVRGANGRLQRCSELLQNGHRTAAIQIADSQPELLQLASTLHFPEIAAWQECAANYSWERAPAIKIELAAVLNDAYAMERQLQPLLKQHRRLALTKAPVADRLVVLREIAQTDRTSPYWQDDIALFEAERARELIQLADSALRSQDYGELDRFLTEHKQEIWCTPAPEPLVVLQRKAVSVFHVQRTLPQLAGEIANHLARQNVDGTLQVLGQWESVCDDIWQVRPEWEPPAEMQHMLRPALALRQTIEQRQRISAFHADLQELHVAIDSEAGAEEIDLLVAKVESHGLSIPPQTRKVLAEHRQAKSTAGALNTAMIVSVLLALVVLVVVVFLLIHFTRK